MKELSIADAAAVNTDELYEVIDVLQAENQNLKTEIRLLTAFMQ